MVEVRDWASGAVRHRVRFNFAGAIQSQHAQADITPDGRRLVLVVGSDMFVWDIQTGQRVYSGPTPESIPPTGLRFRDDGALLMLAPNRLGERYSGLLMVGGDAEPPLLTLADRDNPFRRAIAVCPDGSKALFSTSNAPTADAAKSATNFRLSDLRTGQDLWCELALLPGAPSLHGEVQAFRPDGKEFAIAVLARMGDFKQGIAPRCAVHVLDLATGQVGLSHELEGSVASLAWSPDGRKIIGVATTFTTSRVIGIDRATGREAFAPINLPPAHGSWRMAVVPGSEPRVAVCPQYINAQGGGSGPIRVFQLSTGKELVAFHPPPDCWLSGFAFTSDGQTLAALLEPKQAPGGGRICAWEAQTGQPLFQVQCPWKPVMFSVGTLRFVRGGSVIAAALENGIGLYDARTGRELTDEALTPTGSRLFLGGRVAALWEDGRRIIVTREGAIQTWDVDRLFARPVRGPIDLAPKLAFDPSARAPDLVDRFRSPDESPFGGSVKNAKNEIFTMSGGRYRMTLPDGGWAGWSCVKREGDYAVRVTAKLTGGPNDRWMVRVSGGPDAKDFFGVSINGAGQLELIRLPEGDSSARPPRLAAVNLRPVRPAGESNTLVLAFRSGQLEIAVNGVQVADPVALPASVRDPWLGLGFEALSGVKNARVEFEEFAAWNLNPAKPLPK